MAKILVIAGDNLGIRLDQIDYSDFRRVHFPVIVEDTEYSESQEHSVSWLLAKFRDEDAMAKSSSLSREEIVEVVEANLDDCDLIVHVLMSSGLSAATHMVAEEVKSLYEERIPIINIDSRQTICGIGVVLLRLVEELKAIRDPEEIRKAAQQIVENTFMALALPDLRYLQRGGRIGKAKAFMGSVLKIIPLVGMKGEDTEGVILPLGKGRTPAQVNTLILDTIREGMNNRGVEKIKLAVTMGFGDNPEALADLEQKVRDSLPCDRLVSGEPHLVEAVHCGPRAWAIAVSFA